MNITAADVNKLRTMTGAGMMDCKKALTEAEGDFELAVELLRKKGQKVAASRGDRDATEGVVLAKASADNTGGYIIVLNCETDFVAKNEGFVNFATAILDAAIANNANSPEAVKALTYPGTSLTIEERITEEIGKIGEKIDLSQAAQINAGFVYCYNHPGNKLASIVGFNKETSNDVAKDVAMQTAAMAPVALDESSVPEELKLKEIEIGKELAIQEGKPAEMAEKISQGRLNKFFQENTLLSQQFVRDNKVTVEEFLNSAEKGLTVSSFERFAMK